MLSGDRINVPDLYSLDEPGAGNNPWGFVHDRSFDDKYRYQTRSVLAVPMIGTLDSSRTQLVMESLLQRIVDTGSELAIIDITGVPTVDTLVAQHLLKTVTAIRLMGADCIISGVRPQIAQTIVHLGIELGGITTKASMADAFAVALERTGRAVRRVVSEPGREPSWNASRS